MALRIKIRDTDNWNRLKTSQEILATLSVGEFPSLREKLAIEYDCDIWNNQENYTAKSAGLLPSEARKLTYTVMRILNILEVTSIAIKSDIVNDDICYNYLGGILVHMTRWSEPLIVALCSDDPCAYENLKKRAKEWEMRS